MTIMGRLNQIESDEIVLPAIQGDLVWGWLATQTSGNESSGDS